MTVPFRESMVHYSPQHRNAQTYRAEGKGGFRRSFLAVCAALEKIGNTIFNGTREMLKGGGAIDNFSGTVYTRENR